MVEVAGIEPASARHSREGTTFLVSVLNWCVNFHSQNFAHLPQSLFKLKPFREQLQPRSLNDGGSTERDQISGLRC